MVFFEVEQLLKIIIPTIMLSENNNIFLIKTLNFNTLKIKNYFSKFIANSENLFIIKLLTN